MKVSYFPLDTKTENFYYFFVPDFVVDYIAKSIDIPLNKIIEHYNTDNLKAHKNIINGKITLFSGLQVPFDFKQLDGLEIIERHGNIFYINGLPMSKEESLLLKYDPDYLSDLPFDVFKYLIKTGEIKGKDLTALCHVSNKISEKCDHRKQELYRELLAEHYQIYDSKNPREDYENFNWLLHMLELYPDKPWAWDELSRNPNITWEIVKANPNKPWNWLLLSNKVI